MRKAVQIWKNIVCFLLLVLVIILVLLFTMVKMGERKLRKPVFWGTLTEKEEQEKYTEIIRDGVTYTYKKDLINILLLGIDGRETAVENTVYGAGPKSDAIYLAIFDQEQKHVTFLNISRDTITDIRYMDSFGDEIGIFPGHLTLQYANGDGLHWSCEMTSEAVAHLLDGIPIHAHAALYWKAIIPIVEEIGTIPVNVPDYMCKLSPQIFSQSGYTRLNGRQALEYVEVRDIWQQGTNELRSIHQKEFMQSLFDTVKQRLKKDPLLIWRLKRASKDYLVTDLALDEMLTIGLWGTGWEISSLDIRSLPGESVEGELHDEFHVNEEEKQEFLLDLFYEKN